MLLYYGLGILPSLFFGLRFFLQWIKSEREGKSLTDPLFWKLSICGNGLLATHYFIQQQYPFFLLQLTNAFIAWRNLAFYKPQRFSLRLSLVIFFLFIVSATAIFSLQTHPSWISIPKILGARDISLTWHLLGIFGGCFFAARFWWQWIVTERTGRSYLGTSFWVLSLVGSLLALTYFIRIGDTVSILNYSFGVIPYIRNLVLIRR